MNKLGEDINQNTGILLARNTPVALVVGVASFLGSHLADKLLQKNIQVIGVDDLKEGKKEYLEAAGKNKNFHLIIESVEDLDLELDRLDYIFFIPHKEANFKKILDLFKSLKPRLLLISKVELYDEKTAEDLAWLKDVESALARTAKEDSLNARILRLGPVFGSRMSFDPAPFGAGLDPLVRLIAQSLTGELQKEISLEFSTRALYIDDAVSLAIKCIFAGATAQKIFDGVLPTPIKVAEIKQILLDPVWYENKSFTPTELPPWPTPNLEKTIKFLNWHPRGNIVSNLKETLSFFARYEIEVPKQVPKLEDRSLKMEDGKAEELQGLKEGVKKTVQKKVKWGSWLLPFLGLIFITFALLWPLFQLSWGVLTFRFQLLSAIKNLEKGEFGNSQISIRQASDGLEQAKSIFYSLELVRNLGLFKEQFAVGDNLADLATYSADAAQNTTLGVQALYQSLKSITGEISESPREYFERASIYLAQADEDLSKAYALTAAEDFKTSLPKILKGRVDSLSDRLSLYSNLVKRARSLAVLLPEVVAQDGSKSYLVLLQNNAELRPTGGLISSIAKLDFEGGKLKKLAVNDVDNIDAQLKIHVEPPQEIKGDLGQKSYLLRDSNWEPDFPTAARQASWFYTKETGERVEGVIALDISAMEDLLLSLGSSENLFEKNVSDAANSLFNKLFFLPNQNWPAVVASLSKSLESKHLSIYLDDPRLFSYVVAQNWAAVLPRAAENDSTDFLAPVEANLGANKANYYLDRKLNLETTIGKDGEVSHRLRVAYTNRSPSEAFPAGKYKNRMRIYLPFGSKINKLSWGESDITKNVSSFVEYGRTGSSFLIELLPKEQKTLVLDYTTSLKLNFIDKKAIYRLDVVKQAGTLKNPFEWRVTYPIDMKLSENQAQKPGPQEYTVKTDLSTDRTFKLEFSRP